MIRILIADDHTIVRKGLRQILKDEFPNAFIEEVGNAEELLNKGLKNEWDIIITDISMPGRSGLEVLQQIKQVSPKVPILILSVYPEEHYAIRALKAGASGYLTKELAPEELVKAVHHVLTGKKYITASIAEKLASQLGQETEPVAHEHLSDREFEVLKLLASGKSIVEIGFILSLSATTVSTYRSRILVKMNMKTNADLILYVAENKLL